MLQPKNLRFSSRTNLIKSRYKQIMKKIFTIILFLTFISISAQKNKGILYFNDGTSLEGLVKVKAETIKFRSSKKSKSVEYSFKDNLKSIDYYDSFDNLYKLEYVKFESNKNPKLMFIMRGDFLKLYSMTLFRYNVRVDTGVRRDLYLKKENEDVATYFFSRGYITKKSFKKVVLEYFNDCQSLIEKINNKEFTKIEYLEIIDYYNDKCK